MSTVALAGDWHGNRRWARARIAEVANNDVALILHLGDFGIWPDASGRVYIDQLEEACTTHGVGIWVTPGNHEDWGSLTRMWADPARAGRPLQVSEHIAILPRGHRFTLEGRSFVSLGGAPSVDLEYRERNKDWWAQEAITTDDVASVVDGGYADVMLVHDAPLAPYEVPSVATIRSTKGVWSERALAYARHGAELMHEAFGGVRPRLFAHGHYHVADEATVALPDTAYETRIWSLNCDGVDGNIRYLDLATLYEPVLSPPE
jgi:hypothetical protein